MPLHCRNGDHSTLLGASPAVSEGWDHRHEVRNLRLRWGMLWGSQASRCRPCLGGVKGTPHLCWGCKCAQLEADPTAKVIKAADPQNRGLQQGPPWRAQVHLF